MNIINLVKSLAQVIEKKKFTKRYHDEYDFERDIYKILRKSISRKLHLDSKDLDKIIIPHGRKKEEKDRWKNTKQLQNVNISGHNNTSDIVIIINKKVIPIQVKYIEDKPTAAIQTVIGQCYIASLRHKTAIGIVYFKPKKKHPRKDKEQGIEKNKVKDYVDKLLKESKKRNMFLFLK